MITHKMVNLFGDEVIVQISEARIKPTPRKGYASTPGTGPEGEMCKTCNHARKCNQGGAKQFYKCELMQAHWTGGYGSDILAKSPACSKWEKKINA